MEPDEYLRMLAKELANDLFGVDRIKRFTGNPNLLGAYAEAAIRDFVARTVYPLRVSRGSIIYEGNTGSLPEIDAIIWQASPLPPIFAIGDFGLIPRGSAVGWLEIKRSMYSDSGKKLRSRLELDNLVEAHPMELQYQLNGKPLATRLGVVCLQERGQHNPIVDELVTAEKAVVILRPTDGSDAGYTANPEALYRLTNFLMDLRLRARLWDGMYRVNELSVSGQGHSGA